MCELRGSKWWYQGVVVVQCQGRQEANFEQHSYNGMCVTKYVGDSVRAFPPGAVD